MKTFARLATVSLVVLLASAGRASAQEFRWLRGSVTEVGDAGFDIYVPGLGLNLAFKVDDHSLIPTGRLVFEWYPGQKAPTLKQLVRVGEEVEVHYERQGDRNYAAVVRESSRQRPEAGTSILGILTASAPGTITVEADQQTHAFDVTDRTRLVLPRRKGTGPPPPMTSLEHTRVLVLYRPEAARKLALEVTSLPEVVTTR